VCVRCSVLCLYTVCVERCGPPAHRVECNQMYVRGSVCLVVYTCTLTHIYIHTHSHQPPHTHIFSLFLTLSHTHTHIPSDGPLYGMGKSPADVVSGFNVNPESRRLKDLGM
jgi:hypothetical protein